MAVTVITPPAVEPITVAEARVHCRADAADDGVLTIFIAAARAKCEGMLNRALITRTVEEAFDAFPTEEILLNLRNVQSIVSVVYTDELGDAVTMNGADYLLDARGEQAWLFPAYDTEWPATEDSINAVRVQYIAGFGDSTADVPEDIRAWLLLTTAFLFAQREAFDATGKIAAIPNRFTDSLLDPWRVYGL